MSQLLLLQRSTDVTHHTRFTFQSPARGLSPSGLVASMLRSSLRFLSGLICHDPAACRFETRWSSKIGSGCLSYGGPVTHLRQLLVLSGRFVQHQSKPQTWPPPSFTRGGPLGTQKSRIIFNISLGHRPIRHAVSTHHVAFPARWVNEC